jgi:hypothetical protein
MALTYYATNGQIVDQSQSDQFIEGTYSADSFYIENGIVQPIPPQPDKWSIFNYDTKQWELIPDYINKMKVDMTRLVDSTSADKIYGVYPSYKQINILATGDQELINSTWIWINLIRNASNVANEVINTASLKEDIYTAYQSFLTTIEGI